LMPGDPYWSDVVLLMGFEGANGSTGAPGMTDESPAASGTAVVNPGSTISTSQFKFGSSSLNQDGTSQIHLSNSNFQFAASQFTVECWVNFTSTTGQQFFVGLWQVAGNLGWVFNYNASLLAWNWSTTGSDNNAVTGTWSPTTGVWYNIAADYDGTKTRLYVNGVMTGSVVGSHTIAASGNNLSIGANNLDNNFHFNGFIDELRITKGVARYASDAGFTVPTAAFPRGGVTAPVVSNASFTLTLPVTNGQVVGVMTATNSPTAWSITAGDPSGYYAISSAGVITVTSAGAAGITVGSASLTVQATNAGGAGSGTASITILPASGLRVINAGPFIISTPVTLGQVVGTVTAVGGATAWAIIGGNPGGYYAIDNSGVITITAAGVAGITPGSGALLQVQASNAISSATGTASIAVIPAVYLLLVPHYLASGLAPAGTVVTEGANIPVGWVPTVACDPQNVSATHQYWKAGSGPVAGAEFSQDYYGSAPLIQRPIVNWGPLGPLGAYQLTGPGAVLGAKSNA
jgi:hypothetical protein